ncbi:acyl carrier protein [Lentzea sp. NBRC 105346]|uniref:acyl carrier protein n=1 Tax=Lentzea sp. NBRC 105346 TaxID=3032205 RepID=UPI0024A5B5F8|nr:acyl carrier protein [Lentzea sp. NBRC 105346]GLZ29100.1 acyl carrier protein [Lentzea sp. NBRC 105346]
MSNEVQERKARIKDMVVSALEVEPEEVTETAMFVDDLGMDSLGAIDLLAALETGFGVEIDQAELPRLVNIDAVYEVVAEVAGWPLTASA